MKKYFFGVLTGFIVCTMFVSTFAIANTPIKLIVNGNLVESDVPPQIISGRTMIPARPLAEALGAKVEWDAENNAVVVTGGIQVDAKPIDLEPVKNEESQVMDNNIKSNGGKNMSTETNNISDIKTYKKDLHIFVIKDDVEYYPLKFIHDKISPKQYVIDFDKDKKEIIIHHKEDPKNVVLECIPYTVFDEFGQSYIKKDDYENKILPIINKE